MSHADDTPYGSQNLLYVESVYKQFLEDPRSVDENWRRYFEAMDVERTAEDEDEYQTGTYDKHVQADPEPIIHRVEAKLGDVPSDRREFLRQVRIFRNVNEEDLARLAEITREMVFKRGDYICRQGQTGNDLFFIREGNITVVREGREIAYLGAGEMVGELAVLDHQPRSADIIASTDVLTFRISRQDLFDLLGTSNELSYAILRALSARLREEGARQEQVDKLVRAFRVRGHRLAKIDPLGLRQWDHPELRPSHYGFDEEDFHRRFTIHFGSQMASRSLRDIYNQLRKTYCQAIGAQFMHIDDLEIQEWIRINLEEPGHRADLGIAEQLRILEKLTDAEVFENFLHRKFVGAKRFSLEGSESLIPLLDFAIEEAGKHELDEVIIGMAHRGRLNVLVNIMGKPPSQVFREFQDVETDPRHGSGDVKYHLGFGSNRETVAGRTVHLSLCFNPSHLEFVGPVAMGRIRAKQDRFEDFDHERAMPLLIHGDAAFIGQGVTQEMFNLSELRGYRTGGTVHVVLNNQIGFTTNPEDGRSSHYATDVARMLQIPIFHVNGENPEAVALVIRLAMDFRQKFKKDVVIDMYGYRKYGHNESDNPSFTQPLMYKAIKKRKTVREAYVKNLLKLNGITQSQADQIASDSKERLEKNLADSKDSDYDFRPVRTGKGFWSAYHGGTYEQADTVDTHVPMDLLQSLLEKLSTVPDGFKPNNKIERLLKQQREMAEGETPLAWAQGEALAWASLAWSGTPIRLTGQDAERGTFSHRHAVLHDAETGDIYIPLQHLKSDQGRVAIYNSPLSEIAVMGYEYGYSLDYPEALVMWEAQFGDFCNVAQVIIDQFITSSEEKWSRLSGLVMLLPHGFEGQGPEHSSARLERFLMLAAKDNIQVVNLTSPAQLFHCMRRQILRAIRKPLVIMSPKSLLRHNRAVSPLSEFAEGSFRPIIPEEDDAVKPDQVKQVLVCSGKVYYELLEKREADDRRDVAILRMEQYYPLPRKELAEALSAYPKETPVVWVQEEPLNMGAWPFLKLHLGTSVTGNGEHPLSRVTRSEAASPAVGSAAVHRAEQEKLLEQAFEITVKA